MQSDDFDSKVFNTKFSTNVEDVVKSYPEATFIFVEPRYSALAKEIYKKAIIDAEAYSNALTEKLKSLDNKYRNVMFVSLDHHEKYVSDLSLYVDFLHLKNEQADEVLKIILNTSRDFWSMAND